MGTILPEASSGSALLTRKPCPLRSLPVAQPLDRSCPLNIESLRLNEQVLLVLGAWQNALPRLLVFDNCEEESLLTHWRPTTGGSRILLTSRRSRWTSTLGVQTHALWGLPREESIALLLQYRPDLSHEDGDTLA